MSCIPTRDLDGPVPAAFSRHIETFAHSCTRGAELQAVHGRFQPRLFDPPLAGGANQRHIYPSMSVDSMSKINAICVYCGSNPGTDPAFVKAAQDFGKILAENGVRLVYGGGSIGLMGAVAGTVMEHGGAATGIIPEFLTAQERPRRRGQELIVTGDMHERKRTMFERADAFVALPGGLGTLEELVEQLTWAQLGRHKKPILVVNINGFWDPLLGLIAHMRALGLVPAPVNGVDLLVAERIEDILPKLRKAVRATSEAEKQMAVPAERL